MTKREMFEAIKRVEGVASNDEMVAFLDRQIELASKKRTGETKVQKENAEIVEKIYDYMVNKGEAVTIAEIQKEFELTSNQKTSALVKKLVDANRVNRTKDGKSTVYTVVAE